MFNTLLRVIRRANHITGFQSYLSDLQSRGHGSTPTFEEARRDFREMSRHSTSL